MLFSSIMAYAEWIRLCTLLPIMHTQKSWIRNKSAIKKFKHLNHFRFWMKLTIYPASIDAHVGIHQCTHMCMCMLTKSPSLWTKSKYSLTWYDTLAFVTYYKVILLSFTFITLHTLYRNATYLPLHTVLLIRITRPDKKTKFQFIR